MRCIVLWILDQVQYDGEGCWNDVTRGVSGRCLAWRAQPPLWILDQVQYDGEGCGNDVTQGVFGRCSAWGAPRCGFPPTRE